MFKAKVEEWTAERFRYEYRSSTLKRHPGEDAILCAVLKLERSLPELVQAKTDEYTAYRRRTQPPGASLRSMFKNPLEDFAGRLIEAAGLKGLRIGDAQISTLHANFFINLGNAKAVDVYRLIEVSRTRGSASAEEAAGWTEKRGGRTWDMHPYTTRSSPGTSCPAGSTMSVPSARE